MTNEEAMRKNALLFDAFARRCDQRGLRVTVGISSAEAREEPPFNDLVVRVVSRDSSARDPLSLSERVTSSMGETLALLESQIGMRAA